MRILLVDDEPELLEQIRLVLVQQNYTVDTALDGSEALDTIYTEPYDLILLDVMLPKKDGFTVLREIRMEKIRTPVLLLTAKGDIEDKIQGLDLGADDYLVKPFPWPNCWHESVPCCAAAMNRFHRFWKQPTSALIQ